MRKSYWIALAIVVITVGWIASGELMGAAATDETAVTEDGGEAVVDAMPGEANGEADAIVPKVRIQVSTAQQRQSEMIILGRTHEDRRVTVRAETSGRIQGVMAARGARLAAGTVLAEIDMGDRLAQLDSAEALVAQREAQFTAADRLAQRSFASEISKIEARSDLDGALADLAAVEMDIRRTIISAPFDGVLEERSAEAGDFLSVGDPVAVVVDLDPIRVQAEISERQATQLTWGTKGKAILLDGRELDGRVTFISSIADSVTRTFSIELEAPNADASVSAGLTAELHLTLQSGMAHRLSPAVLTLSEKGEVGIKTVDADNRVHFIEVVPEAGGDGGIWVSGLPETIRVITVGQAFVSENQLVSPVTEQDMAARSEAQDTEERTQ